MVQLNLALREINCKVVYFGCGLGGKTTNLEIVHEKAAPDSRGDLTSIATESDRTLFFDFMPLDLGTVSGMRVKFQLYTVPGQVYYNSTRKLVLRGADGVIFVADSQREKMDENLESIKNLADCLKEQGRDLSEMPHVIQFNKRDLDNVCTFDEMKSTLNEYDAPCFEAIASKGDGVLETFKALAAMMLDKVKAMSTESSAKPGGRTQRLGGDPRTASQRIATDAHRLQGGLAATPVEPIPIAREAMKPAPFREPAPRSPAPSPARPAAAPTQGPVIPEQRTTVPLERPKGLEQSQRFKAGEPAEAETRAMAPVSPAASTTEKEKAQVEMEVEEDDSSVAMATVERVRPSQRRPAEVRSDPELPNRSRSKKTTSGVRVAGGGIMITTSARRRKRGGSKVGLVLGIIVVLAGGAAAAWYFLL